MALKIKEKDMNTMLESIKPKDETYKAKTWSTIMSGTVKLLALGALSNVSAYVGVTENEMTVAVLDTIDISHIYGELHIRYDQIKSLKIKKSIIPGQRVVHIETDSSKLKMTLFNNPLSAKIPNQKEAIEIIIQTLNENVHC